MRLKLTQISVDPRGTLDLCARAPTTDNKTFNRVPRGIRSQTHTAVPAVLDPRPAVQSTHAHVDPAPLAVGLNVDHGADEADPVTTAALSLLHPLS